MDFSTVPMQSPSVNQKHILFLLLLWFSVHVFLFVYPGIRLELFDSKVYASAGNYLLQVGRPEKTHQIFYFVPVALIGVFNSVEHGLIFFIIFQSLISALAVLAIYKSASSLFDDSRAGLFGSILFLLWWDMIQWNTALLTESLFCSLVCFLIFHLVRFNNSKSDYLILLGLLSACVLTRPTGIIAIAGTGVFLLVKHGGFLRRNPSIGVAVSFLIVIVTILTAYTMFSIWDFSDQYVRGNIVTYIDLAEGNDAGLRIDNSKLIVPDPNDPPLEKMISFVFNNPAHFVQAGGMKIFYLLSGIRPYYSFSHNAFNIVWNVMIYALFVIGYKHGTNQPMRAFALAVIIINCLLIGISTVDWDNRFYVPMVPALVLFSAGGGLHLAKRFLNVRTAQ